jgi:hypothetical protein
LITSNPRIKSLFYTDFNDIIPLEGNLDMRKILNKLTDNEMEEEASRFYAQHKRNVSFTASMD